MPLRHDRAGDLLRTDEHGLYCPAGDFYIDPWRPKPGSRAVITHAHSDHARAGAAEYLTSTSGSHLLRSRLGAKAAITPHPWGLASAVRHGDALISLHPAGHVLGSAMVRVQHATTGETWVVSGDYKLANDAVSEPWEPVTCDVFITESTFGLPVYRWPTPEKLFADINAWWAANKAEGLTSVLFGYSLGKAQRLLAGVDPSIGPLFAHGAVMKINEAYVAAGVRLPAVEHATREAVKAAAGAALVIAPPGNDDTPWLRGLGDTATAMASGWMHIRGTRRRRNLARGFALSDHADWPGLNEAVALSKAKRVGVTHGYVEPFVRWLNERGQEAFALKAKYEGDEALRAPSEAADVEMWPAAPEPGVASEDSSTF